MDEKIKEGRTPERCPYNDIRQLIFLCEKKFTKGTREWDILVRASFALQGLSLSSAILNPPPSLFEIHPPKKL